jgi:hypothetical protein
MPHHSQVKGNYMSEGWMKKVTPLLLIALSVLFVFHNSLNYFFTQDDFVWLRIAENFSSLKDALQVFFQYNGAGNYRPLTQELFFLANYKLFGLNPVAFHASALLVQIVNAFLVYAVLQRLFNNRLGSLAGAVFYGANATLFISVYWVSAVSESGMATFFLLCVFFFIRFLQQPSLKYYGLAFAMFVAAMMSKEAAIAIPPILLLIYLYLRPGIKKGTVKPVAALFPFVLGVVIYLAIRMFTIGMTPEQGPYKASLNFQTLVNLYQYLIWSLNGFQLFDALAALADYGSRLLYTVLSTALLFVFFGYCAIRQGRTLLFAICWFVTALLPVLPFANHTQNYYVNIATVAISILIAAAISNSGKVAPTLVGIGIPIYLVISVINIQYQEKHIWVTRRAEIAETALNDIQALHPTLPENAILYFKGTGEDEYWAYNFGDLFKLYYHNNDLGTLFEKKSSLPTGTGNVYQLVLRQGHLQDAPSVAGDAQNWSAGGLAAAATGPTLPDIIDFAREVSPDSLGMGWNQSELGHRWTTKSAVVYLPGAPGGKRTKYRLIIKGSLTVDYFAHKEAELTLKVNGRVVGNQKLNKNGEFLLEKDFEGNFDNPLELGLELDQSYVLSKVSHSVDTRELGISVTSIQLLRR